MRFAALGALLATGCSFIGVRGPSSRVGIVPDDPAEIRCSESSLWPSLDALGGAAAISVAGGGVIIEQTSEEGDLENFTKYYAAPLVAVALAYFISANFGNTRITWCSDAKERAIQARDTIRPVEFEPSPAKPEPEPEPDIEIHH